MSNYWRTCIEEAISEIGIIATKEQTDELVQWVEGAHENFGMAHGHECIPNPAVLENKRLEDLLAVERSKIPCKICGGNGSITSQGPVHSSRSQCWKCNGEGKHTP